MNTNNKILPTLGLLLVSTLGFSQTVSSVSELQSALDDATAGTTITIENGTYTDADLEIDARGTQANPIIIQAETPGEVIFEDDSRIKMGGDYITLTGVVFTGTYTLSDSGAESYVVAFSNDGSECNNCKLTQIQIDDYNPRDEDDDLRWVHVYGQDNEISYNTFINKKSIGSMLFNQRSNGIEDRMKIHHNYFAYRDQVGEADSKNDIDVMRIGDSSQSLSNSSSEIYDNYFYEVNGGEPEVISNKSSNNQYYNNTFQNYLGALSLRHGNDCKVYNNFFLNKGQNESYFNGGIRVEGERHLVYNNYIQGTNGTKQNSSSVAGSLGGINVSAGQSENNFVLNGYGQVIDAVIVNNTIVDCDQGLRIGPDSGGSNQNVAPDNITVANNLFVNCREYIEEEREATNSTYSGNMFEGSGSEITGFSSESGLLSSSKNEDGYYPLESSSPAINASVGDFTDYFTDDILFGSRNGTYDVGALEYGVSSERGPYTQSDVGATVGFGAIEEEAGPALSAIPADLSYFNETEMVFVISSNVEWSISTDVDWLTFDVTSGSGIASVTAIVTRNTTGQERVATVSVTGGGLESLINVMQEGPSLSGTPSELNFLSSGSDEAFTITSNVEWSVATDADWLTFDTNSGINDGEVLAMSEINTTGLERFGTITITDTEGYGLERVINIMQTDGSFDPEADAVELTVIGATAVGTEPGKVEVNPDFAWDGEVVDYQYWTGDAALGETSITFDLECNHQLTEFGIHLLKADERTVNFDVSIALDGSDEFTTILADQDSELVSGGIDTEQLFSLGIGNNVARYVKFTGYSNSDNGSAEFISVSEINIYGNENCDITLGNEDFESLANKGVTLFAVPVTNGELKIVSPKYAINGIKVYSMSGAEVVSSEVNNENATQVDVSSLVPGVYFLVLEEIGVAKFIVE